MIPQTSDVKMNSFIILAMMMRAMDDDIFSDLIRSGVTGEMNNWRCGLSRWSSSLGTERSYFLLLLQVRNKIEEIKCVSHSICKSTLLECTLVVVVVVVVAGWMEMIE
jgi:hypothetical protein